MIVLDASAAVSWLLKEPSPIAGFDDMLLSQRVVVPAHWTVEVGHAVLKSLRRKQVTTDKLVTIALAIRSFDIKIETAIGVERFLPMLQFARDHGLTMYDAAYVQLAMEQSASLATLDGAMRRTAEKLGVQLAL